MKYTANMQEVKDCDLVAKRNLCIECLSSVQNQHVKCKVSFMFNRYALLRMNSQYG